VYWLVQSSSKVYWLVQSSSKVYWFDMHF
jgi:hypothetical protein